MRRWIIWGVTLVFALVGSSAFALTGSGDSATVMLETVSPKLESMIAVSESSIGVTFSEPMLEPGVTTPGNYVVSGFGVGTLSPHPTGITVGEPYTLTWTSGGTYATTVTVTATGLQDAVGNPIDPAHNSAWGMGLGEPVPLYAWPLALALLIAGLLVQVWRHNRLSAVLLLLLATLIAVPDAFAQAPSVSSVVVTQSPNGAVGTKVDITYDLVAPTGPCAVMLSLSKNGGADGFSYPITHYAGDISGVTTGTGKHIVWDIRADYPELSIPQARIRVTADDAVIPPPSFAWVKTWSGGYSNADRVAVDAVGNIYVAGDFSGTVDFDPDPVKVDSHTSSNGSIDASLSKFDASGNLLWVKTWGGGSGRDVAYGVGVDSAGNAYVVGPYRYTVDFNPDPVLDDIHTSNYPGENNIYLSKFAPDGTFQWVRTWGPTPVPGKASFGGEAYTVVVEGNYLYVVGDFSGDQVDFNPWGSHDWHTNHPPSSGTIQWFDAFLSKFDLEGSFQWAKTWGGEGYDDGPGVAVDGTGHVYVAGMYASQTINFDPAGGSGGLGHPAHDSGSIVDVFLSKFDASGNFQWVRTWGGQGTEDAMGLVAVDGLNNVYVAGRTASVNCDFNPGGTPDILSTNGGLDAFLSKFDSNGNFQWARTWGGSGNDDARGLAVDLAGTVYVAGVFSDTIDFDPGSSGVDNHSSNGLQEAYFSKFDSIGNFQWAKTWGGSGNDTSGVTVDRTDSAYAFGNFVGTVDFDTGSEVDNHTADGTSGAYLSKFVSISR